MNQLLPIIRRKRRILIIEAEVKPPVPVARVPVKTEPTSEPLEATASTAAKTKPDHAENPASNETK